MGKPKISSLTLRFEPLEGGGANIRFLIRFSNGATLERQTALDTPEITLDFRGADNDAEEVKRPSHTLH